ncbi:TetR/AcrR family transcriptional regulator [Kineococcus rhizosphaerae]|uniref:TetR family transcriptional regulator n=1 Tax=Kineococcus rhizosphaerae TaxID=559628 RepID=A0A2T0QYL5_9ACTN|nr:TetR/AcrR family transcriptional regulator [Kineococcus rhizosphaerae]PRY11463.1 TetR family transcriptional regulator [Kineococcus rhizosphaerae]
MPRERAPRDPAATRDRLVDAFAAIVVTSGARSATLEAVAARAGVSKGGLLYHFASKSALVDGLLARLRQLTEADLERMRTAPEGPAEYYVRTSALEAVSLFADEPDPLSTALVATLRLAQEGESRATAAFAAVNADWRALIETEVGGDRSLARMVQLVGDGLWGSASMGIPVDDLDVVLDQVRRLVRSSRHAATTG